MNLDQNTARKGTSFRHPTFTDTVGTPLIGTITKRTGGGFYYRLHGMLLRRFVSWRFLDYHAQLGTPIQIADSPQTAAEMRAPPLDSGAGAV
jgi:hypothetical protein